MVDLSISHRPAAMGRVVAIPAFLVVTLVILRVVVGFHFYREGTKKLTYDPASGDVSVKGVTEPFLRMAVGPVAEIVREELPNAYNWERYLARPKQSKVTTEEQLAERAKWEAAYAAKRRDAQAKKEPLPVEFPPYSPYYDWAGRIEAAWGAALAKFAAVEGITPEQKSAGEKSLLFRRQQLADYLAEQSDAIAEWEHELWRLRELEKNAASTDLPFLGAQIEEKRAETKSASAPWIAQVRDIEFAYLTDLRGLLNSEQVDNATLVATVDKALADANKLKLHRMDIAVTAVIIGTGVCLMLGLFTRLAALCGIGFLLSVIATQPPWEPGAVTTVLYYQLVEIAALLVLFASGAGRWAGIDYLFRAMFARRRAVTES